MQCEFACIISISCLLTYDSMLHVIVYKLIYKHIYNNIYALFYLQILEFLYVKYNFCPFDLHAILLHFTQEFPKLNITEVSPNVQDLLECKN
jgi:hypothetical protein